MIMSNNNYLMYILMIRNRIFKIDTLLTYALSYTKIIKETIHQIVGNDICN